MTLLDLEPIEVNIFRGRSPDENRQRVFGGQVAGQALVAAARTVDEPTPPRPLAARLLPAPRRPDGADPLRGRPDPRRAQLHHPTRRRHPARPGDLQPAGQLPRRRAGPRPPDRRCRTGWPDPESLPDLHDAHGAVQGPDRRAGTTGPARSTCATSTATRSAARARRADSQRVWLRADGQLPDDPVAPRLHRHLRQRHDPARHHRAAVRAGVGQPGHADGQPRPRDVVPPPVPRRRVAAVRPARAVAPASAAAWPAGRSSPRDGRLVVSVVQEGLARVGQPERSRSAVAAALGARRHGRSSTR